MKNRQFAVIGLGRFGENLVKELNRMGYEVLAIDVDENRVNNAKDIATYAVEADTTDEQVLTKLGIRNFDVVVVAIGDNIQSNTLTTILLKEMGVKTIVTKARNSLHGKVLEKIGADIVVYPERDMAIKVAHSLASESIVDFINLSAEFSIVEMITPQEFINKTLVENNIRKQYKVNIIAIKRGRDIIVAPGPDEKIINDDILVVLGKNKDLTYLSKLDYQ